MRGARWCGLLFGMLQVVNSAWLPASELPDLSSHPVNAWIKRTPIPDSPVSPRMGYEGACVWDQKRQLVIRYGGHNQGGGGEQGAEVWTFDLRSAKWTLMQPNISPPGVCCNAQNVYDPVSGRYIRFPFFSGSHGWQWWRELYMNDSAVWTYDLGENRWRNRRPLPAPKLAPYRCASWDSEERVVLVFGGEGSNEGTLIYDPARNEWRWPKPAVEPAGRSGGNLAYDAAHKLHVLFGSQFDNDQHTWTYDVRKNEWRDMQPSVQPPTNQNDAVLTYDPGHQRVLAIIKVTTGEDESAKHELQTWGYDTGKNTWQRLNPVSEPEASGNRCRNLFFAPGLNLAILENCTSKPREQQIWTYRFEGPTSQSVFPPAEGQNPATGVPPLVEDGFVSVISPQRVEVSWTAPAATQVAGYHVERALVEVWTDDQLKRLKRQTPPQAEPAVGAIRRIGPFRRLTRQPIAATRFVDTELNLSEPQLIEGEAIYERPLNSEQVASDGREYRKGVFAYRVRTVGPDQKESGPSSPFFTIPSSPQQLFSREAGTTCQLKWAANPERGIAGYRVYRMDGRYDKDPISRLTTNAITQTSYTDENAGKSSRRYYVIAVDALGQEGFPSSPVWFQREWQDYYKPFVDEWHQ